MIVTISDTDTYHFERQNAAWASLNEATKMAAILRAEDYLRATYRIDGREDEAKVKLAAKMLSGEMTQPQPLANTEAELLHDEGDLGNGALKTVRKYARRPTDRYPQITALLSSYGLRGIAGRTVKPIAVERA